MRRNSNRYPHLRAVIAPELASLPDDELELRMSELLPGVSPVELEESWSSFTRTLGKGAQQVGNVLGRAAPGMLQGAVSGAAAGSALGPYGMLAGALGGAALGGYQSYQTSRQPQTPQTQRPAVAPSRPLPGTPAPGMTPSQPNPQPLPTTAGARQYPSASGQQSLGTAAAAGGGAATQLLGLLSRPEVLQALMSLAMGQAGRRQVMVGQTAVPTAAIANAVGTIATQAAGQSPQMTARETESATEYLQDTTGNWLVDPGDALSRTEALINLLSVTPPPVIEGNDSDLEDEIEEFDEVYEDLLETGYDDDEVGEDLPDWFLMYIESGDAESDEALFQEDIEFDEDEEDFEDEMELELYDY